MIDWMIEWLNDWMIEWLIKWMIEFRDGVWKWTTESESLEDCKKTKPGN